MAVILDGKATSAQVRGEFATAARALTERTGVVPGLAVVIVGDDPASQVYVRNKRRACEQALNCPPTQRRRHWRHWWTD